MLPVRLPVHTREKYDYGYRTTGTCIIISYESRMSRIFPNKLHTSMDQRELNKLLDAKF